MSLTMIRDALLWCTILNFVLVAVWVLLFMLPHDWMHGLWGRWFRLPVEQFNAVNFAGIVFFEMGIFLFNLVPYIALRIVG